MTATGSRRLFYVLSLLALASPAVVGLIRAAETRWADLRYLWMAAVAIAVSIAIRALWPKERSTSRAVAGLAAVTLLVTATAWALGARHPVGVGLVSISYGLACAGSLFFAGRAERAVPAQP